MMPLRKGILYGHCDENVGVSVVKTNDPSQRIDIPVVNQATIASS